MNRNQIRNTIRNWLSPPACLLFAIWVFVLVWNLVTPPFTDLIYFNGDFYFDAVTLGVNLMLPVWMGWHAGVKPFRAGVKVTAFLYSLALLNLSLLNWRFSFDKRLPDPEYVVANTWALFFGSFATLTLMAWWFPKTWRPTESKKNQRRMSIRTYLIWLMLAGVIFAELTNGATLFRQDADSVAQSVVVLVITLVFLIVLGPLVGHMIRTPRVKSWAIFYSLLPFWLAATIVVWFRVQPEGPLAEWNAHSEWETWLFISTVYTGLYLSAIFLAMLERWRNKREKLKNRPDTPLFWLIGNGWAARIAKFSFVIPSGWLGWWIVVHAYQASHYNKFSPQREMFTGMTGIETKSDTWPLDDYFNRIAERPAAKDNLCVPLYRHGRMRMSPEIELRFCHSLGIEPNPGGTKLFQSFWTWIWEKPQTDREDLFAVESKATWPPRQVELKRSSATLLQELLPFLTRSDYENVLRDFCWTDADVPIGGEWAQEMEPVLEQFIAGLPNYSQCYFPSIAHEDGLTYFIQRDAIHHFTDATLALGNRAIANDQQVKAIEYRQALQRFALILLQQPNYMNFIRSRSLRQAADLSLRLARSRELGESDYRKMQEEWHALMLVSDSTIPRKMNLIDESIWLDDWFSNDSNSIIRDVEIGTEFMAFRTPAIVNWRWTGLKCRETFVQDSRSVNTDAPLVDQMRTVRGLKDLRQSRSTRESRFIDGLGAWMGSPVDKASWVARLATAHQSYSSPFYTQSLTVPNQLRLTIIGMAIERFRVKESRLPVNLADLVDGYLNELPKDLWTNDDFIYRVDGNTYALYSVGQNGVDDSVKGDDTLLELPWEWSDLPKWIDENAAINVDWIGEK